MDSSFHARPHVPSSRARSLEILRRLIIILLTAVLLAGLLFLLAAAPAGQAAPPPAGLQRPAATNVDVDVTSDTTWTSAGSPWILTRDITVTPGVTLTVEPGVTVKGVIEAELRVPGDWWPSARPTSRSPSRRVRIRRCASGRACSSTGGRALGVRHSSVTAGDDWKVAPGRSNVTVRMCRPARYAFAHSQVSMSTALRGGNPIGATDYGIYVSTAGFDRPSPTHGNGDNFGNVLDWPCILRARQHRDPYHQHLIGNIRDRVGLANGAMMAHDTTLTRQAALEAYQFNHPSVIDSLSSRRRSR